MKQLYSLRKDFAIIGLTGRSGAGCSTIAAKLSNPAYIEELYSRTDISSETNNTDKLKFNICLRFLAFENNFKPFYTIKYSHILFYQMLYESFYKQKTKEEALNFLIKIVFPSKEFNNNRFLKDDESYDRILAILIATLEETEDIFKSYECDTLEICLKDEEKDTYCDFFTRISPLAQYFFDLLREIDYTKTNLFLQDIACNLRATGSVSYYSGKSQESIANIYIIAETINRLIKCFREKNGHGRIVIDSLKNSLELTFFKERYAAFYCIATNKLERERIDFKFDKIKFFNEENAKYHLEQNIKIDKAEYAGKEVNQGEFASPDIENCIQKSEFHIFYSDNYEHYKEQLVNESEIETNLDNQLVKFLALLFHPGIITPSPQERNMQVAFIAKANSGCISRQVGAVVTDSNHSIKAIGWNDVAQNQIPCNLRNLTDFAKGLNKDHYSDFEKGEGDNYNDGSTFDKKIISMVGERDLHNELEGRNCSFCFKTCHNVFEGKSNQVHTRSLHAEENAMLQITKYGGQGIKDGSLYTTASPCELCSKKAFQLGIKTIYFIDPYPGIATSHILKSGIKKENNPTLLMFRGAVGRGFHKLYEPFMAYKDELNIRANIHPKLDKITIITDLTKDENKQRQIEKILNV